jgi:hypothetical protein
VQQEEEDAKTYRLAEFIELNLIHSTGNIWHISFSLHVPTFNTILK